jgi:hypothetical protein
MPGERLRPEQRSPAAMQNHVIKKTVYKNGAWTVEGFDKEKSLQPLVKNIGGFKSAVRKWVTNYWYIKDQCSFVTRPNGTIETFPDTWGLLALQLFFDRYSHGQAAEDISVLVAAAYDAELHKLIGVPEKWLDEGLEGAADIGLHPIDWRENLRIRGG